MARTASTSWRVWGTGAAAGRQAALLFGLGALLDLASAATARPVRLHLLSAALNATVAVVTWLLPWARWPRGATLGLTVPALASLGWSTWAFGGADAGTGPFYVLAFTWLGLHHSRTAILALAPVVAVAYGLPLALRDGLDVAVSSAIVLVPVSVVVALLVEDRVSQLRAARDELARTEVWRAALMTTLAHDVRSPLTTVRGALELLRDEDDLPRSTRTALLASALRQTARITRLATGLLDVDRVSAGLLRLDLRDVDLAAAARHAAELANAPEVEVDVPAGLSVRADPERLEQMLVNLVLNASRHGGPPTTVTAREVGRAVEVEVCDSGPGVPEAERAALFSRYRSGDVRPGSVGLGLSIVESLALAHGGDVRYEDARPGARFVLTLPR